MTAEVLVVGSGFAGLHACRALERRLPAEAARITLVSPTDYLLYSPLLPEVAAGVMDPRDIAVPLAQALRRTTPVLALATEVNLNGRTLTVRETHGENRVLPWDRLVLCPGSVTRDRPVPGLDEHAHGFKTLAEAIYLRDHVLQQLELANTAAPTERAARCTFVVVGAGYAGTEVIAQLQHDVALLLPHYPHLSPADLHWVLLDAAAAVLPELGEDLGMRALGVLRGREVDVRLSTELSAIRADGVTVKNGGDLPTHTVVWTAGVNASPLIGSMARRHGLELDRGRLVVDAQLRLLGHEHIWALGDAAACPDLTRPGSITPPTAQHAQRQGKRVGANVAASLGVGQARPYRHHDLGLVVDLAGRHAVAKPLRIPLQGLAAKTVTRAYHLFALPSAANRTRVATDWLLDAVLGRSAVQLGYVPYDDSTLPSENT